MSLSRRTLLRVAPLTAVLLATRGVRIPQARADEKVVAPDGTFPGMIVRMEEPRNLEFPFPHLKSWKTPSEHFYVRNHFAVPEIDAKTFRVTVSGHVENKLDLSLDDIRRMEQVTKPLTMECAGNGRVHLVPAARGLQWGEGAVGNAEWTGVPLAAILERARVKKGAVEVLLVGADKGAIAADPATPGAIHFDRSLPLEKALKPEVLLAHKMNGEDLSPAHGFPLRAVVGGWFGMASVKWLTRIVVLDRPHGGYWQTMDYSYFVRRDGEVPTLVPLTAMQPKASISRPALDEIVPASKPYRVFGAAWSGESAVKKVEISLDGGATWQVAELEGKAVPFCWRLWTFTWNVPAKPGRYQIVAKATDEAGNSQPEKRDPDRRSYMINHLVPVAVQVK